MNRIPETKSTRPLNPKQEVSEVHCMIHPHFFAIARDPENGGHKDFNVSDERLAKISIDPKYKALQKKYEIKPEDMKALLRTVMIHKFYKDRVDEVAANPSARLVILQSENEDATSEMLPLAKLLRDADGPFKGGRFQQKLIVYAREKLGDRLQVLNENIDPNDFADSCARQTGLDKLNFKGKLLVYGESLTCCPKDAAASLERHGFKDVELKANWCPQ